MSALQFFFKHAGYSWNPAAETRLQGRWRCARQLAAAEAEGRIAGISFEWSVDPDCDSSDWSDERPSWPQYECIARNRDGDVLACLAGIDFGREGSPGSDPYARVVEAELAAQVLP